MTVLANVATAPVKGVINKVMSRKLSQKELRPDVAQIMKQPRQPERANSIDLKHVIEGLRVIREKHRPTLAWSPPLTLPSERYLPVGKSHSDIGIQQPKALRGG